MAILTILVEPLVFEGAVDRPVQEHPRKFAVRTRSIWLPSTGIIFVVPGVARILRRSGRAFWILRSSGSEPHRNLMTWSCPPMGLAEPWSTVRHRDATREFPVQGDVGGIQHVADARLAGRPEGLVRFVQAVGGQRKRHPCPRERRRVRRSFLPVFEFLQVHVERLLGGLDFRCLGKSQGGQDHDRARMTRQPRSTILPGATTSRALTSAWTRGGLACKPSAGAVVVCAHARCQRTALPDRGKLRSRGGEQARSRLAILQTRATLTNKCRPTPK